ncbi:HD domain-containing protein [Amycolatopsis acidicola]|uniref:HD domain-containing protein n=1 Tax=Amycolatopsis acidicola TaxID=2596893 RepID=A0A5N0UJV2_9PSEU|nr:HD domain-containing protein [Amycolatopsis acidicola]KAA9149200.1 HD domain-containing protein [Amycolatopsis acidicola]
MPAATVGELRQSDVDEQIRQLERRLAAEQELVPASVLHDCVRRAWARFSGAKVRAYIPILVERRVRAELRSSPGSRSLVEWSRGTAERLLAGALPRRWAHTQGVAGQAAAIGWVLPEGERDVLVAAAWLHDIGYADGLVRTGMHQIDGALFLREHGVEERICALVAQHAGASAVAELQGLSAELAQFPDERGPVRDALWYSDMTTSPVGEPVSFDERMAELRQRRGPEDPVVRALAINGEERAAAVRRTQELLERKAALRSLAAG